MAFKYRRIGTRSPHRDDHAADALRVRDDGAEQRRAAAEQRAELAERMRAATRPRPPDHDDERTPR